MAGTSNRSLLIRDAGTGGAWSSPEMTAYTDEDHLQAIIADAPHHVPGVPDGAVALRELSTTAGPADVCIVDPNGEITVVECKLASNSERRRLVIGQVLDYAAAIWQAGAEAFHRQWTRQSGPDLSSLDDGTRTQLDRNIGDGRIHLCLAVDLIDADLRRLIEYLNRITRDDVRVTALQLTYARHGDIEILTPSTFGAEVAAAKAHSPRTTRLWTKDAFLYALAPGAARTRAAELFTLLEGLDERKGTAEDLWFGRPPTGGVFLHPYGLRFAPLHLLAGEDGELLARGNWTNYPQLKAHPGFEQLAAYLGQDRTGPARKISLVEVEIDRLWPIVLRCALQINAAEPAS
ncbi:hypothetical protein NXT08_24690 (plasmid) [Rhodococcus pyridinivorans]|uniref:hypothetical protein n=1 Tax=Rhodococcus pyridinivorans TaxID=103816 RepID=UPI0021649D0A|nr:hypothetical protein [Rhodococcus pyridinivorans]UVT27700.1 hypothetical protein NXT08_24690 [Rhodococcus pyridinivorans]